MSCALGPAHGLTCWGLAVSSDKGRYQKIDGFGTSICASSEKARLCDAPWITRRYTQQMLPHGCAIQTGGRLACGSSCDGHFVDGGGMGRTVFALRDDGTVFKGEIDKTMRGQLRPQEGRFVALAAPCALADDGKVVCFDQELAQRAPKVPMKHIFSSQVGAGVCGIGTNERVLCWNRRLSPEQFPLPDRAFTEVRLGYDFACGRTTDGRVLCWGNGAHEAAHPPATVGEYIGTESYPIFDGALGNMSKPKPVRSDPLQDPPNCRIVQMGSIEEAWRTRVRDFVRNFNTTGTGSSRSQIDAIFNERANMISIGQKAPDEPPILSDCGDHFSLHFSIVDPETYTTFRLDFRIRIYKDPAAIAEWARNFKALPEGGGQERDGVRRRRGRGNWTYVNRYNLSREEFTEQTHATWPADSDVLVDVNVLGTGAAAKLSDQLRGDIDIYPQIPRKSSYHPPREPDVISLYGDEDVVVTEVSPD